MSMTEKDLTISRVIRAPRSVVWKAWKEPEHFVKWWAPAPVVTTSNKHEFFTGGGFDTTMQLGDGTVMNEGEGCFLEVVENERIVFTDALQGGWRPNEEAFFSAIITLQDHLEGTLYTATALHKNNEDRQMHAEMGFVDGWGAALTQLAKLAEEQLNG
jgi:uncharacterized protein YndB with AHSA1/START domain